MKYLIITWSDNTIEMQPSSKVICNNLQNGEKVMMQWKKDLWTGTIESVWGKYKRLFYLVLLK